MLHIHHHNRTTKQSDHVEYITNYDTQRILDALEHEMQRYNQAADLVTDQHAREAISEARHRIKELHTKFCNLLDPDEE